MRLKPAGQSIIPLGKVPIKGIQWVLVGHRCWSNLHSYNKSLFVGPVYRLSTYPQQ